MVKVRIVWFVLSFSAISPEHGDILTVTARPDCDNTVRTAAYEVLNVFVQNSAQDSAASVAQLSSVILERLENTIPMQSQVVSVEDMQTSLCSVMQAIIQRLDKEIVPRGDRIIQHTSSCAADTHTRAGAGVGAAFNTFPLSDTTHAPSLLSSRASSPWLCVMRWARVPILGGVD
ncbi:hypothetical protein VSDG_09522 [Cytospora chrysosperma]|uniref:Importin subunit beta-1/Transportin-1-like TPR repeats domain-containing protein n=1 Tax=Cytospora chrysosperma TaxID=252740 RepID=A0A423VCJ5_CYTCH|nr:hypothetical protein VSDG_09522 [Valsa sordida]